MFAERGWAIGAETAQNDGKVRLLKGFPLDENPSKPCGVAWNRYETLWSWVASAGEGWEGGAVAARAPNKSLIGNGMPRNKSLHGQRVLEPPKGPKSSKPSKIKCIPSQNHSVGFRVRLKHRVPRCLSFRSCLPRTEINFQSTSDLQAPVEHPRAHSTQPSIILRPPGAPSTG